MMEPTTREEVLEELVRLYNKYEIVNGQIWNKYSIYKNHKASFYFDKYGGIKRMLSEIGIKYLCYNQPTKKDVEKRATALYNKHGRLDKAICVKNNISTSTVKKYFGTYNDMFKSLGLPINMNKKIKRDEVIKDIKEFTEKYNSFSSTLYRKYGTYSQLVIDRYGGWTEIMKELGHTSIKRSEAEKMIQSILEEKGIKHEINYNFNWLKTNRGTKMFVDFYIPSIETVIEYDGAQHTNFVPYFHKTVENFNACQERDRLKESLLEKHGIKIFRIAYSDNMLSKLDELLD